MTGIAAIYARISNDALEEGLGVDRQEGVCREKATALGLTVGHVFVDNDISASTLSKKPRPEYDAMLERVTAGEFGTIIAYSNSRLTRRPAEWIDLISLANSGALKIATCVSGSHDLTTADGRAIAITVAAWDAAEAERTGERVKAAAKQRAEMGIPKKGRYRTFGYTNDFKVIDEEAAHIKDAFARVIRGESLQSIASLWRDTGVSMGNGKQVHHSTVRHIVSRPLYASLATYKGEVVGRAQVDPIVTEAVFHAAKDVLQGNSKPRAGKNARTYLLAGLVQCGQCGIVMSGGPGVANKSGNRRHVYICRKVHGGCGGVGVQGERIEAIALSIVKRRLTVKDWAGPPDEVIDYQSQIDALEVQMTEARSEVQNGSLTFLDIKDVLVDLSTKKRALERLAAVQESDRADYLPGKSWEEFREASLSEQMATVGTVVKGLVINKATSTKWDPSRVTIFMAGGNVFPATNIKIEVKMPTRIIAGFRDREEPKPTLKSRPVKDDKGRFIANLPAGSA